jgi:hypothetical protein
MPGSLAVLLKSFVTARRAVPLLHACHEDMAFFVMLWR